MITYRILPGERLIIVMNHARVPVEEVMAFRRKLYADPAYAPEYDVINDSRKLKKEYSFDEIENIATHKTPHSRIALIVSSDLSFGVGRTWEMLVDDGKKSIKVFRESESALSWLGKADIIADILAEMAGGDETKP